MTITFRSILIAASLCTMLLMLKRIRNSKVLIEDVIFWIIFSVLLLVMSIFPVIGDVLAGLLGIYSTVNFIFLFMIFILLIREFSMTIKISQMENKIKELTQEIAIQRNMELQNRQEEEKERCKTGVDKARENNGDR